MIGIYAPFGKMGQALIQVLSTLNTPYITYDRLDLDSFLKKTSVVIDFSTPTATDFLIDALIVKKICKPLVVGTTGLTDETIKKITILGNTSPVFYAQNFSLGVFVQKKISQIAAKLLDYDVEIFEAHHAHKKDAPSGTALHLGEAIADTRGLVFEDVRTCYQHPGKAVRQKDQIGFSVARGGSAIGEHTVHFFGASEELIITHKDYTRSLYAEGALLAANFLRKTNKNSLYGMDNIFNESASCSLNHAV